MQTKNPIFDDIAEMMTGAAGAMASAGEEMRSVIRSRADRMVMDMDLVSREEFDLVKEMAARALSENEKLREEITTMKKATTSTSKRKKPTAPGPRKTSGVK
ncbi:MAG: hypothetical protein COA47_05155 [Robiginitomaculum sp.]|nr:MAG: hypothetical protein COA47_05155 [Robiginitomaculum sp.]